MKTPAKAGMQLISRYDNLIEPALGQSHVWLVASLERLMHNAIDGGVREYFVMGIGIAANLMRCFIWVEQ